MLRSAGITGRNVVCYNSKDMKFLMNVWNQLRRFLDTMLIASVRCFLLYDKILPERNQLKKKLFSIQSCTFGRNVEKQKFLVKNKLNCFSSIMCPAKQRFSRTKSPQHKDQVKGMFVRPLKGRALQTLPAGQKGSLRILRALSLCSLRSVSKSIMMKYGGYRVNPNKIHRKP